MQAGRRKMQMKLCSKLDQMIERDTLCVCASCLKRKKNSRPNNCDNPVVPTASRQYAKPADPRRRPIQKPGNLGGILSGGFPSTIRRGFPISVCSGCSHRWLLRRATNKTTPWYVLCKADNRLSRDAFCRRAPVCGYVIQPGNATYAELTHAARTAKLPLLFIDSAKTVVP